MVCYAHSNITTFRLDSAAAVDNIISPTAIEVVEASGVFIFREKS